MKKCPKCGKILPLSQFDSNKVYCKTCRRDYEWQYKYGISPEQYWEIYKAQDGKCKICGKEAKEGRYLCVDHNKTTGEIRGLLCKSCNNALGFFYDNVESLYAAIDYLKDRGYKE